MYYDENGAEVWEWFDDGHSNAEEEPAPRTEEPPTLETPPATMSTTPTQGDPSHVFVGTDWRGDVWQLVDAGGNVIEWAVAPGADSRSVISGTVVNLGKPSPMTIAQAPAANPIATPAATTTPPPAPAAATPKPTPTNTQTDDGPTYGGAGSGLPGGTIGNPVQGDSRHVYVGRDASGDVWQIWDGANVIQWSVAPGDDSRNVRQSTVRNLGPASSMTIAQATPKTPAPVQGGTTPIGASGSGANVPNSAPANNTAPSANTAGTAAAPGRKSDPRHQYVGRDASGDLWQLVDEGGKTIQWSVIPGAESGAALSGTVKITATGGTPYTAPAANAAGGLGLIAVVGILSQLIN